MCESAIGVEVQRVVVGVDRRREGRGKGNQSISDDGTDGSSGNSIRYRRQRFALDFKRQSLTMADNELK
jgi:hypothetical protein